ncbi:MAG: site-2 protease family protein, partial [Myxococcota bacterium]
MRGAALRLHWTVPLGAWALGGFGVSPWFWLGYVVVVASHEFGHAVLAWRGGHRVVSVDITGFGGACRYELADDRQADRGNIAWGGVLAQGLVASIALLWMLPELPLEHPAALQLWRSLVTVNLALAVFNLLPVAPLDGAEAWPWLADQIRGARKLAFQRQFTLLDGVAPAIEPPMDIPERLTRRRRELAKPSRRRPR